MMFTKVILVLAAFLTATGQEVPRNPNNLLLRGSGSTGEVFHEAETDKEDDYDFEFENERLQTTEATSTEWITTDPTLPLDSDCQYAHYVCTSDDYCCSGRCYWFSETKTRGTCA